MYQITFCPQVQQEKSLKLPYNLDHLGYVAEIFGIFYSQWDYQMVNISRILKFLTWHGFDEFGWNDPLEQGHAGSPITGMMSANLPNSCLPN